jgi:hypothetical protein
MTRTIEWGSVGNREIRKRAGPQPVVLLGLLLVLILSAAFLRGSVAQAQGVDKTDTGPPAVNPGRPTVTDPAALTAPGWLETELGGLKDLDRDRTFSTPFVLKLTSRNNRLQYRLGADGLIFPGQGANGFGDTNAGLQYLFASQSKAKFDLAGRIAVKLPTAPDFLGTRKVDYNVLFLASRDFSPSVHGDFNLGLSNLSRQGAPGTDNQFLATASFTLPIKGGRWQYTNEIVYASPIEGQKSLVTTMHGFTYAVHRYDVYDIAVQWQLHGDGANLQLLFGKTFFLGHLFEPADRVTCGTA